MKKLLFFSMAFAIAFSMDATVSAQVIVDNYITQQNGATAGAVGNFRYQSFTPNVTGLGVNDTVAASAPIPATLFLQSADFLSATTYNGPTVTGEAFIDVYQNNGAGFEGQAGTYLGSSSNSNNVFASVMGGGLELLTWNFNSIALDSTLEHAFVFSDDNVEGSGFEVRLQVARDAGGLFGSSYAGGVASNAPDGTNPTPFDSRFQVTMSPVPEPTSLALLGLGLVGLAARRRRS